MKFRIDYYVKNKETKRYKKLTKSEIENLRDEVNHPIVTDTYINSMFFYNSPKNILCFDEAKIFAYRIMFKIKNINSRNKLQELADTYSRLETSVGYCHYSILVKAYYRDISYIKHKKKIGEPEKLALEIKGKAS